MKERFLYDNHDFFYSWINQNVTDILSISGIHNFFININILGIDIDLFEGPSTNKGLQ